MSYGINSILYASDLTPRSPAVFHHAVGLAARFNARLHAITISLPATSLPYMDFSAGQPASGHLCDEALLRQRIQTFAEANPDMPVAEVLASVQAIKGDPSRCILDAAKNVLADMIVMGSRRHSALGELLLGSVAHKVMMGTDVPVVLVPIYR